ncbi:retention in endoplasmic reticulum protein 1, variant 2 [Schistosoma haematobium]|uniref:Protein RER1 n=2 Tax=Schistosoma TaxID=6181 RepID=A0A922LIB1_SCHHA|nr:retention in endoplasmic reticulum protein 1, variant 2 [Schistosoma haematobium]KAH9585562.1 retention in endoplasmic reticulum protein 1, variant 2 [Schistosoma haematobium]
MKLDQTSDESSNTFLSKVCRPVTVMHQTIIDKLYPYRITRWLFALLLFAIYVLRIATIQGFHIVSYTLAIYLLSLFISFISPKVDPAAADYSDEIPTLPRTVGEEFRPFIPRLLESKFWFLFYYANDNCNSRVCSHNNSYIASMLSTVRAVAVSIFCTYLPFLDIPVFWPILVMYFIMLFAIMMKKQIKHMIKYRYVPFTYGKPRPVGSNNKEQASPVINS